MGMDLSRKSRKKGRAAPEMNVTPLVDVVLVLLIIFMVITPLLTKQFWVHLPDKKEETEPLPSEPKEPVVVTVSKDGQLYINRDAIDDASFPRKLRRVLAARQDRTIFFDAHDEAAYGRAAVALDLARGAGASTIAVATDTIVSR
jgi:biopolymer transport protein ExbD/biopolymer transport protein TolR